MSKAKFSNRKVAVAWTEMVASLSAGSTLDKNAPSLLDYALHHFEPKAVIERLLDPRPAYFALNDILFAGLCAWTVCPHAPDLVEEAMVLAGVSRMADLEEDRKAHFPQDPFLADIVARLAGPGIDFYRDFYYPMGGLRRVLSGRSPNLLRQALRETSENIGFAIEMMRVCHHHALHLQDRARFRKAAIKTAGEGVSRLLMTSRRGTPPINSVLLESMPKRTVDGLNCTKKAAPFRSSAALIYAAYSLRIKHESLLEIIRDNRCNFKEHGHLMSEWFGRAVFVARAVIEPMYPRQSSLSQVDFLPNVTPVNIEPPAFGSEDSLLITLFKTRNALLRTI